MWININFYKCYVEKCGFVESFPHKKSYQRAKIGLNSVIFLCNPQFFI